VVLNRRGMTREGIDDLLVHVPPFAYGAAIHVAVRGHSNDCRVRWQRGIETSSIQLREDVRRVHTQPGERR
jgi:hypothetical protein